MNRRRVSLLTGTVLTALGFLSACADGSATSPAPDSSVDTVVDATDASTSAPVPVSSSATPDDTSSQGSPPVSSEQIDPGLSPFIGLAVADLAERLAIDAADISVTSATLQVWSDSALGCPQPGRQYAQVTSDGSLIVLTANSKTYRYHAGGSRTPFLCELTSKAPPITGLSTP